ncbi:MAG: hypothetical protein OEM62_13100, partial [Acidobacteriota bacterium]|nr:hypothetical protein [Acidobacteriota bacterium]
MTRVAIINSESLMGKELKLALSGRRDLWDEVRLLTAIPAEVGTVTEGVVGAAFVQELSDETAEGLDVVIVCPGPLPATESPGFGPATILYLCPSHPMTGATSIVAGVNADAA